MALYAAHRNRFRGFTLPEMLVVMAVIAVLIAVLLPALTGAKRTADMASSQNNMKQIALMMRQYSTENREYIVPSQFNYKASVAPPTNYPVKVRSDSALTGSAWGDLRYKGTWADILWTFSGQGGSNSLVDPADSSNLDKYEFDSPDKAIYDSDPSFDSSPFRAAAPNTRDFYVGGGPGNGPLPFGTGAAEAALPGFFAANNFFNADPAAPQYDPTDPAAGTIGRWFTNGQIIAPDRSMYLVDSLAGETIDPLPCLPSPVPAVIPPAISGPYDNVTDSNGDGIPDTLEVDFRYTGACLMLFLDGHSKPISAWKDLNELRFGSQQIRIRNLDRR